MCLKSLKVEWGGWVRYNGKGELRHNGKGELIGIMARGSL